MIGVQSALRIVFSMASSQLLKTRRGAVKQRENKLEDTLPSDSQSSGDDKVAQLAEKMRRDVCTHLVFDRVRDVES